MKFTIDFDMTGSAFDHYTGSDSGRDATEAALILRALSERINCLDVLTDQNGGTLRDSNGNSIGSWDVTQ
jgi:hypothetical protein